MNSDGLIVLVLVAIIMAAAILTFWNPPDSPA